MIRRTSIAALGVLLLITGCRSDGIHAPKQPPPTPVATEAADLIRACDRGDQPPRPSLPAIDLAIAITESNLKNAETTGFKQTCVVSDGVASKLQLDADQGAVERTGRELDVAISGNGFFALKTPAGTRYTRDGNLFQDANGQIVSSRGYAVMPPTFIPPRTTEIVICTDGTIACRKKEDAIRRGIATLHLYRFAHPDRLMRDDDGLLMPTAESGKPIEGLPAEADANIGSIFQTFLEASNVDVAHERERLRRLLDCRIQLEPKQEERSPRLLTP